MQNNYFANAMMKMVFFKKRLMMKALNTVIAVAVFLLVWWAVLNICRVQNGMRNTSYMQKKVILTQVIKPECRRVLGYQCPF